MERHGDGQAFRDRIPLGLDDRKPPVFPQQHSRSTFLDIAGRAIYIPTKEQKLRKQLDMEMAKNVILVEQLAAVKKKAENLEYRYRCRSCCLELVEFSFRCGNSACSSCAADLSHCHICQEDLRIFIRLHM